MAQGALGQDRVRELSLPSNLGAVEAMAGHGQAALVIIDPLAAFLDEGINSYRDSDIRRALFPLARLAESTGVAIVLVRHLNKAKVPTRCTGAVGPSVSSGPPARACSSPPTPRTKTGRVLAVTKSNLSAKPPALAFHFVPAELHDCARIVWDGAAGTALSNW